MKEHIKKPQETKTTQGEDILKQRISVLETIALDVAQLLDLNKVLQSSLEKVIKVMGLDAGGIYLFDVQKNELNLLAHQGLNPDFIKKAAKVHLNQFPKWRKVRFGSIMITKDFSRDSEVSIEGTRQDGLLGFASIPLKARKRLLGYLNVAYRKDQVFDKKDVHFLSIVGNQIGIAIDNARLYQEIKESEEKYRTLIENPQEGVIILKNWSFLFFNLGFLKLIGYRESELLKKEFTSLVSHDHIQNFLDFQLTILNKQNENPSPIEISLISKSKKKIEVEVTGTPIIYKREKAVQYVLRDVTEKKRLEEQLIRSEKLALAGQVLAGITHEIRNPLASMYLSAQNLASYLKPNSIEEIEVQNILKAGQKINQLLERFLNFTRPEKPVFVHSNLNHLLDDAISLVSPQIQKKKINIHRVYSKNLPTLSLSAEQIGQVFVNILLNGIQAIEKKGTISIKTKHQREKGQIKVEIKDTGKGISPEVQKNIFDAFFSTKKKGIGLGLAVTARILEKFGITFSIDSKIGKGTTFHLTFPTKTQ